MTILSPGRTTTAQGIAASDRVLVVGAYGVGNAGDEAVLAGLVRKVGGPERLVVVSRDPAGTSRLHGVRAVSAREAVRELRSSDVVVIGGGGLFSSHMGARGRAIPYFGLLAMAAGKRVLIDGVSVDATTPRMVRPGLVHLARHASSVTVRDSVSAALLRSWGAASAEVGPDLSEFLSPAPKIEAESALESSGLDLGQPIVALCLTAVDRAYDDFLRFDVPGLVSRMPGVQFCFLPLSQHPGVPRHDDRRLGRWLSRRLPRITAVDTGRQPAVTLAMFGLFSAAVCMRYHSFLFADRSGTPIVGVPYAAKCERWMADHGLQAPARGPSGLTAAVTAALGHRMAGVECAG